MDNDIDHDDDVINPNDDEETKARKRKRKRKPPEPDPEPTPPEPDPATASRFSGQAFVPVDSGTIEERVQRRAVIAAFDAADKGDYQPGIDLGIFPDPDSEDLDAGEDV